jgi:hypothetical protein
MNVYRTIVEPYFDYCCIIWDGISDYLALAINLENRAAHIITGADYSRRSSDILNELGWAKLSEQRQKCKAVVMHKILNIMHALFFLGLFRP